MVCPRFGLVEAPPVRMRNIREAAMARRAQRLTDIRGFGIDRVAARADLAPRPRPDRPVLRLENLDTDLPLPPGVVEATITGLSTPRANSWLPFTGDMELREAIADHLAARTGVRYDPQAEIVVVAGGTSGVLATLLAVLDPGDECVLTAPTYAGLV